MALEVLFVGVAAAWPGAGEETACYVVDERILIDTGWNAALTMKSFGIDPVDIEAIFFTHCHQDHTLGLPGMFFSRSQRKEALLRLFGPRDLPAVRDGAFALLQSDRYPDLVPEHEVEIVFPGDEIELGGLKVSVGRSFHPLDARCYRFEDTASGGSVVFTGDTAYHEGLASFAEGCDVLIHEAAAGMDADPAGLQRFLHSRPQDAARIAQEGGVSHLALVHYPSGEGQKILAKAKEVFPNTRLGKKGQRLQVLGPGQVAWV